MMFVKVVFCATMLLLAPPSQGDRKSNPAKRPAKVEKSANVEKSINVEKSQKAAGTGKSEKSLVSQEAKKPAWRAIEINIVKYTNEQRVKRGLKELQIDPDLMKSARRHAAWMARNRSMVHTSRPVAENIAMGQPHSKNAVGAWMNSSGHRANILNRGHRRIGVAAYRSPGGAIYWCQQFRR